MTKRHIIPKQKLRPYTLDSELFLKLLTLSVETIPSISTSPSPADLDNYAENITTAIQQAYSGAALRSLGHNKGNSWWDKSCRLARSQYKNIFRSAISPEELKSAKKDYRRVTRKAKESFYESKIENVNTSKELFGMVKWHKSRGIYRSSPIIDPISPESPHCHLAKKKSEVLIRNLLTNYSEVGDIPTDVPSVPSYSLPFPQVSTEEIKQSVLNAGNTAPGPDEISTSILRQAWLLIETHIQALYTACLKSGHHPCWCRNPIISTLPKPNKTDLSLPRSYRPIALLSVLVKGLERLMAKRMA